MPVTRTVAQLHDLTGRTALVTGGSRGLGFQMAQALGEAGARLLISARKADELTHAVARLSEQGISADWVVADAGDEAGALALADAEGLKGAVLLFASDVGKHITGQLLAVDGGASAVVG